ncbi:MAG: hypothetical protein JWO03_2978 [Bacteroidetes bacterium]|nr:hypothetical protein [Bacteroidota bacterium]
MTNRRMLIAICVSGFLAVALGAFGAHSLRPHLSDHQAAIWDKAVAYQFYHTLAALIAFVLYDVKYVRYLLTAAYLFLIGVAVFSGSLYVLATADLTGFPKDVAGPLTPVGGILFLLGWGTMIFAVVKYPKLSDK